MDDWHPWIQTASGAAFNLIAPDPAHIDFDVDVAEALARTARFGGHVRSGPYSVAQHCCIGADAIWRETGDSDLALAFLLHDAHEAYLGDITTPMTEALIIAIGSYGAASKVLSAVGAAAARNAVRMATREGLRLLKANMDRAIWTAAGLDWPMTAVRHAAIKSMDLRMLATERRHLLGPSPHPWGACFDAAKPLRLPGGLRVWPWAQAADEWRLRFRRWKPADKPLFTTPMTPAESAALEPA